MAAGLGWKALSCDLRLSFVSIFLCVLLLFCTLLEWFYRKQDMEASGLRFSPSHWVGFLKAKLYTEWKPCNLYLFLWPVADGTKAVEFECVWYFALQHVSLHLPSPAPSSWPFALNAMVFLCCRRSCHIQTGKDFMMLLYRSSLEWEGHKIHLMERKAVCSYILISEIQKTVALEK